MPGVGAPLPADAADWLHLWRLDPGTPHRDEQGWPIFPRTKAGLARLGVQFVTGVDLAVQNHSAADHTVLYTIAVLPPHGPRGDRVRRVCEIQRGKWYANELEQKIVDVRRRFGGIVVVENVAAQDYICQNIRHKHPDAHKWLVPFTTGRQKASPEFGIDQLGAEFAREQWVFPVGADFDGSEEDCTPGQVAAVLQKNIDEILFFDPRDHTGDILMGQWFAKIGTRMLDRGEAGGPSLGVNVVG